MLCKNGMRQLAGLYMRSIDHGRLINFLLLHAFAMTLLEWHVAFDSYIRQLAMKHPGTTTVCSTGGYTVYWSSRTLAYFFRCLRLLIGRRCYSRAPSHHKPIQTFSVTCATC